MITDDMLLQILDAVRELAVHLGVDEREQGLADHFVRVVGRLMPERQIAVRLVQSRTLTVTTVATTEVEEIPRLTRESLYCEKNALLPEFAIGGLMLENARLEVRAEYHPVLSSLANGFSILISSGGELNGIINIEGSATDEELAEDKQIVCPFVAMLGAALRNRRLAVGAHFLKDRLAKILDYANSLIFVVNPDHKVNFFNKALLELTGYFPEEVLGSDIVQWLPEAEQAEFLLAFQKAIAGEPVRNHLVTFVDRNGDAVRTVFNLSGYVGHTSNIESVIAIGQDNSALNMLEQQVIQAEKMSSLGQMAAGVIHEINNPLTSVTVYTNYLVKKLKSEGGDPADVVALERIMQGAERILKCIRDLTDYARPSSQRIQFLELNEQIEQALFFCEPLAAKHKARIKTELERGLSPLYGVKDQIQQVFINLITNACQSLGSSGGEVTIHTWRCDAGHLAASIADTGRGIEERHRDLIFEPFFTTKAPGEGTGLGLSTVKKIIDFHQGDIKVESRLGQGTKFVLTLPTGEMKKEE